MVFYYIIFIVIVLFVLLENKQNSSILFACCGIMLFSVAAFRCSTLDKDYLGYVDYYDKILFESFSVVEPTFILIVHLVDRLFSNSLFLFIIYAFIGVFLKFYAINVLTRFRLLSVLIYFSSFYLLHEMTQIRVGIAAGLLLLCVKPIKEKKLGKFIILAALAFLFHYSAIIIFPLFFLTGDKLSTKLYMTLIPASYLIYYTNINLLRLAELINIPLIQVKISSYISAASLDNEINIFNYLHLSRCLLAYLFLYKWDFLIKNNEYVVILIKIYCIAIFVFIAFAFVPGVSSRASELLMVVEIVLIPMLLTIFRQKRIALLVVIAIGFVSLSFSLFYTKLLTGYSLCFGSA